MKNLLAKLPEGISGKTILIAGGSNATGQKITLTLAQMGAKLFILGENQLEVDQVLNKLSSFNSCPRYYGMVADPSSLEDIKIILDVIDRQFRGVDILINNNMFTFPQHYGQGENLRNSLLTKLKGQYYCTVEVLSRMERQPETGYILNVNTIGNEFRNRYRELCDHARTAFRTFNAELCKEAANKNVKVILSSL
ncbi:MAG TPA: SDR family NAD(P)-dependent oxidoreductase [Pedobacter sp.]|nr:SDR family NAD(P)-dependent oxidoreductase [Pedobacter sp.]